MERWVAKMLCGIIMFIVMPICFLLPIKLAGSFQRWGSKGQWMLDLLTCFAGGVFLASYLVFMAPAVRVLIEENLMKPYRIDYPFPDMIIGLGFFAMMLLDKLVKILSKATHKKPKDAQKLNGHNKMIKGSRADPPSSHSQYQIEAVHKLEIVAENEALRHLDSDNDAEFANIGLTYSPRRASISGRPSRVEECSLSRQQSIIIAASDSTISMTRSLVMMLALSLDSILEGMTIGLKRTVNEVWAIFVGIIVHESVIAFCLGLQLVRIHKRLLPIVLASVVYTLMNPIGVVISTIVYERMENDPRVELANGILQALTSGCFIYIIFYEILESQINQDTPLSKILATFIGYIFLSCFAALPGSSSYRHGANLPAMNETTPH